MTSRRPFIVGIGGTAQSGSSTEQALMLALAWAERAGAETCCFGGSELVALPHYLTEASRSGPGAEMVAAVRRADGVIIASPGYHGSISGLVKNGLDYLEQTSRDPRVYLDGLPVGLIATAYGPQAAGGTLAALRTIVHGLRAFPTPLGAVIISTGGVFRSGVCTDDTAAEQLATVGRQVVEFAKLRIASGADPAPAE